MEDGTEKWTDLLSGFYGYFQQELKVADKNMEDIKRMEQPTNGEMSGVRRAAGVEVGQVRFVLCVLRV